MSNVIHETAVVTGDVTLGERNFIGPFCRISGPVTIGDDNYFDSFVSIGSPPQDDMFSSDEHISLLSGSKLFSEKSSIIQIGNNNVFREFVTIHKPIFFKTQIGNSCYLMTQSHVSHDTILMNNVKIANSVQIGGFSIIQSDAYLGLSSNILQFTVVGGLSMIGMSSLVNRNIFPGSLVSGLPAKTLRANVQKLSRLADTTDWWADARNRTFNQDVPVSFLEYLTEYDELVIFNKRRRDSFYDRKSELGR